MYNWAKKGLNYFNPTIKYLQYVGCITILTIVLNNMEILKYNTL